ncbi:hypothetical protein GXM_02676 [Nostoc sphaeroides CCNUC1]|uniref:Uncharacterized protein n=1 Tax=Nostoc sphaeroides CCNUC1 TaxID=2653204 RepID=A0A5P8VZF8_9NOSO|nr:hypothetical protein GXM_02676 [Nostoc sphaeroides CCNUC1]
MRAVATTGATLGTHCHCLFCLGPPQVEQVATEGSPSKGAISPLGIYVLSRNNLLKLT